MSYFFFYPNSSCLTPLSNYIDCSSINRDITKPQG
nr:MAG TPA: hypothetical protein [Caudoviricetes sp.]